MASREFMDLFAQHLAMSFDKQTILADVIGKAKWQLDYKSGELSFGEHRFATQYLGVLRPAQATWEWGWSGKEIPVEVKKTAEMILKLGRDLGVPVFIEPSLSMSDDFSPKHLSVVATGLCGSDAYFGCPFQAGTLYVSIKSETLESIRHAGNIVNRMALTFPQVLRIADIPNHRKALRSYIHAYGLSVADSKKSLVAVSKNGDRLEAQFDDLNRLVNFKTHS